MTELRYREIKVPCLDGESGLEPRVPGPSNMVLICISLLLPFHSWVR